MKSLLTKYKLVVRFILTFVLVYAVLSIAYMLYLDYSSGVKYYPDFFTNILGVQTEFLLNTFGYQALIEPHLDEASLMVFVNRNYTARIIEGCNGLSVIILFIAFVLAFSSTLKKTIVFVILGSILIYLVNLTRVVLLTTGIYHYPESSVMMHEIIFPILIYGFVFLLWFYWVKQFSDKQ